VIFRVTFLRFLSVLGSIRIYRKSGPTKSTVLGPRPPPGKFINFIEKMGFLWFWGPSIEPEKRSLKSASTANPPQKVTFIAFLSKLGSEIINDPWNWFFNSSRLNLFGPILTIKDVRRKQFFCGLGLSSFCWS
jgi:hypothetical protein